MNRDETHDAAYGRPGGRIDPLVQVRAYWEGLRDDNVIPQRSQINPRGIEQVLSSTFLIERVAPGVARFRIAGMDFSDVMGIEVRAMPISAIFMPTSRAELTKKLEQVFAGPAMMTLDVLAAAGLGRPALTARLMILPLRDGAGQVTMALGCINLKGSIGRSPRRFDIAGCTLSPLAPIAPFTPRTEFAPQMVAKTEQPVFAEDAAEFEAGPKVKPFLRVVK